LQIDFLIPLSLDDDHIRFAPTDEGIVDAMCKFAKVGPPTPSPTTSAASMAASSATPSRTSKRSAAVGIDIDPPLVNVSQRQAGVVMCPPVLAKADRACRTDSHRHPGTTPHRHFGGTSVGNGVECKRLSILKKSNSSADYAQAMVLREYNRFLNSNLFLGNVDFMTRIAIVDGGPGGLHDSLLSQAYPGAMRSSSSWFTVPVM